MSTTISAPTLSNWATEQLSYYPTKLAGTWCARRLWCRLTPLDQNHLGGDLKAAYERSSIVNWWIQLHGVSRNRAVLDIAKKLNFLGLEDYECLLREIGESTDVEEAIRMAIDMNDLVLVERPRSVYWKGENVEVDFTRLTESWEFIWELARHGKAEKPVDRFTFGENASEKVVSQRKFRLTSTTNFPIELDDSIKVVGRGTQQLQLPPEQIRVFEVKGLESLGEWFP